MNSVQSISVFAFGSLGIHGAGCTSPSGVRRKSSRSPNDRYIRPENPFGTPSVISPPGAGPAIATSGAGTGGFAPAGHGVNVPP